MSTLVMSEQNLPHHPPREDGLTPAAAAADSGLSQPTPTTAPTTATTTVTADTQPSSSIDPTPALHLDPAGGGLSGDETAVESPHRGQHTRTKSVESDSEPHPLSKSVADSRYHHHQPSKSVDSHKRTKSTDSHHQRTKSTASRSPPASPGRGYPPSPGSAGYPPSPSAAMNTTAPPPSSFRASGFLDFLHSAGSKRSSVYDVERDSEVAAVVGEDATTDLDEDERARATALRAGMNSRMRREWDELEREEREIEMERRRLEEEEAQAHGGHHRGPSSAVASSGAAGGGGARVSVGAGGLVPKTKHPMSSVPRSSYYTGPPAMGSAFGSAPAGQIGVHFPREIVRVERDYTGGELCQFYPNFLMELEGRVTPTEFMETINSINEILVSAHSLTASFWDNALSALTLFTWSLVFRSHYDKEMQRLQGTIEEWNRRVYNPRGLNILWPRSSGFLFLEIEYY